MELSTYFRINAANTGQFERTLIIADEGSHVSYLEGCTAPMRDENQLHAAVVELVALDDARSSTRRCRTGIPATRRASAASTTSSPSAANAAAATRRSPGRRSRPARRSPGNTRAACCAVTNSVGEFYSVALANNYQQADTGTKMIHIGRNTPQHDRLEGHLRRPRPERLPRPREDPAVGATARATTRSATRC